MLIHIQLNIRIKPTASRRIVRPRYTSFSLSVLSDYFCFCSAPISRGGILNILQLSSRIELSNVKKIVRTRLVVPEISAFKHQLYYTI